MRNRLDRAWLIWSGYALRFLIDPGGKHVQQENRSRYRCQRQESLGAGGFQRPDQRRKVTDDTRIRAALPTIEYLLEQGAAVILFSHLGRPKGGPDPKYSMKPVADYLGGLVKAPVKFCRRSCRPQSRSGCRKPETGRDPGAGKYPLLPGRREE